jgi:hypothetical protein
VAGTLKIAYDLALYGLFRRRPAEHETGGGDGVARSAGIQPVGPSGGS